MNQNIMKKNIVIFIGITILLLVWAIIWTGQKKGCYLDEYYTYTLTNGIHLGIDIKDGEWNSTNNFFEELVTREGDRFDFAQTCKNTADDVHPPVYYLVLNVISSVFPGNFSLWFALTINIVCFLMVSFLLYRCAILLTDNSALSLLVVMVYAINPSTVTGLVYLRMYFLFSVFAVAYGYLHMKMLKHGDLIPQRVIPLIIIGFFGFLTHYYMLFVMFCISFFFAVYFFFIKKQYIKTVLYGVSIAFSLVMAYLVWPVSYFHMFKGYRGKGATNSFLDFKKLLSRIIFFMGKYSDKVLGRAGLLVFLLLVVLFVFNIKKKTIKENFETIGRFLVPVLGIVGYFFLVSFTALVGDYSNRYEFPIIGLTILYLVISLYFLFTRINLSKKRTLVIISGIFIILSGVGYLSKEVDFLYRQQAEIDEYINEHKDADVVVFSRGTYDALIGDLVKFPRVFIAGKEKTEEMMQNGIQDETLCTSQEILFYAENGSNVEELMGMLLENNKELSQVEKLWECNDFYSIYRVF